MTSSNKERIIATNFNLVLGTRQENERDGPLVRQNSRDSRLSFHFWHSDHGAQVYMDDLFTVRTRTVFDEVTFRESCR